MKDFGQLPGKLIYREIEEIQGVSLADYITKQNYKKLSGPDREVYPKSTATPSNNHRGIIKEENQSPSDHGVSEGLSFLEVGHTARKLTFFTEYEAIEIAIQIIDLLEILHSKNIVHTNLNPENIFLRDGDV